jgi:hypothetical protein
MPFSSVHVYTWAFRDKTPEKKKVRKNTLRMAKVLIYSPDSK